MKIVAHLLLELVWCDETVMTMDKMKGLYWLHRQKYTWGWIYPPS